MAAQLIFDEAKHAYLLDGQLIPSVTQVLQCAGISDYSSVPQYILERAAWVGEETHRACQFIDEGDFDMDDLFSEIKPYVEAYLKFKEEKQFKPELIEHRGCRENEQGAFGFCIDRTGTINGQPYILDLKTSSKPQPSWPIQTAGYALGLGSFHDASCLLYERAVVWLRKDATYELQPHEDYKDELIFESALRITHWRMKNGHKLKL